jgi:hypothetical protein
VQWNLVRRQHKQNRRIRRHGPDTFSRRNCSVRLEAARKLERGAQAASLRSSNLRSHISYSLGGNDESS